MRVKWLLLVLVFTHKCSAFGNPQIARATLQSSVSSHDGAASRLRSAKARDLAAASALCIEAFGGPFPWYQRLRQLRQEVKLHAKLRQRFELLQANKISHKMVVATDSSNEIIGFMELGMLPPPMGFFESQIESTMPAAPATAQQWNGAPITETREVQYKVIPDDVPYLANLVVAEAARGQGLGAKMVKMAELLVARKWPTEQTQLFVAVEESNAAAQRLYERCGFQRLASADDIFGYNKGRRYYCKDLTGYAGTADTDQTQSPETLSETAATTKTTTTTLAKAATEAAAEHESPVTVAHEQCGQ